MNCYKVPKKTWKRWRPEAREAFNEMYATIRFPADFSHPKAPKIKKPHWAVLRWNMAWMAAEAANTAVGKSHA